MDLVQMMRNDESVANWVTFLLMLPFPMQLFATLRSNKSAQQTTIKFSLTRLVAGCFIEGVQSRGKRRHMRRCV